MMPLITCRSSPRGTPRDLFGRGAAVATGDPSARTARSADPLITVVARVNHAERCSSNQFMGPDPGVRRRRGAKRKSGRATTWWHGLALPSSQVRLPCFVKSLDKCCSGVPISKSAGDAQGLGQADRRGSRDELVERRCALPSPWALGYLLPSAFSPVDGAEWSHLLLQRLILLREWARVAG